VPGGAAMADAVFRFRAHFSAFTIWVTLCRIMLR
jgi:hypothetical protein